jgi:hypothetical protein
MTTWFFLAPIDCSEIPAQINISKSINDRHKQKWGQHILPAKKVIDIYGLYSKKF